MVRPLLLLNTLGVAVLAVLAAFQWWNNRAEHERLVVEQRGHQECETQLAEVRQRASSLEGDVERLKAGLTDAQKAADEASAARTQLEGELKVMTAERDQLKLELPKWQAAVKDRDNRISELATQLHEARARLDEAIKRLAGKKSQ